MSDFRERAAIAFRRALALDSGFAAPLAGLIETAAFARDTVEVRRLADLHSVRTRAREGADYIRWRVAVALDDSATLSSLRARFDSLDTSSLAMIQWTSQVDGVALEDAERAVEVMLRRAGDRGAQVRALMAAGMLALNRGRSREALRRNDAMVDLGRDRNTRNRFTAAYALYWDGVTTAGAQAARRLERSAAAALASDDMKEMRVSYYDLFILAQWQLWHGDTGMTGRTVDKLRRVAAYSESDSSIRRAGFTRADVLDALFAAIVGRKDAPVLLDRLDSLTQNGCCETPHPANLVVARLREREGNLAAALSAVRRQSWYFPPEYLSTSLREEGRLAALTGDRGGAIKAYRHYLALRSNPEPAWQADAERVRAELRRLERLPR